MSHSSGDDDRGTYASSWSVVLPGDRPFHIGLIPSMAVENAYRAWRHVATASAPAAGDATTAVTDAAAHAMRSLFLPLSQQQAVELRRWVVENESDGSSEDSLDHVTGQVSASAAASQLPVDNTAPMVLSKLMVDFSTGTCQLLLPVELLRGLSADGTAAPPTVEAPSKSSFAFLGDGTPLALQRDGITVGPDHVPTTNAEGANASHTPIATSATPQAAITPASTSSTPTPVRSGRSRQKVVWSWEGAGRLHAYTNAVSRRIEEGYVNYLCLKRDQEQANAAAPAAAEATRETGDRANNSSDAAAAATPTVTHMSRVTVRTVLYEMDYAAMVQRNPRTGRTRPIKREGPAPLLPVRVRDTTSTLNGTPVVASTVATGVIGTDGTAPPPAASSTPTQTLQQLVQKLLPGKWQFMRVRGRKWFDFDDADGKAVEDAYQDFIVQFRTAKRAPDLGKTLGDAAVAASASALAPTPTAPVEATSAADVRLVPTRSLTRSDMITASHRFANTDMCTVVVNDHQEPFEAFLQHANDERATLVRLLYSSKAAQFVLAVAVWEILGDTVLSNAAALTGKGSGRLEEVLTELGTDGASAADAFTEQVTQAMCEVAALSGRGVDNSITARRLLPNRGVVKGVACGTENFTYTFDFIRMMETNEQTSRTRRIRRVTADTPGLDGHYTAKPPAGTGMKPITVSVPADAISTGAGSTSDATATADSEATTKLTTTEPPVKLPLDKHIPHVGNFQPVEIDGEFYYCMLNQANVVSNANKFYVIQLVKDKQTKKYGVFTRFGRVGDVGTPAFLCRDGSLDWAVKRFKEQFQRKARCKWENREAAKPKAGHYAYMKIDLTATDDDKTDTKVSTPAADNIFNPMSPPNAPPSKLHPLVKDLMAYISDRSDMSNMMERDFALDVKRMPLGHITKEQIKDALNVLSQIDDVLRDPTELQATKKLTGLSNTFYTLVPHRVHKMERLPIIGDARALHKKVQLMQNLGDLEIAADLLKKVAKSSQNMVEHPLDAMYRQLQCQLTPLPDSDPIVSRIRHYVQQTRGATHYNIPTVEQVFAVDRTGEDARYEAFLDAHKGEAGAPHTNRVMLWHGSRKTNYLGILARGLRIAPPEAPSTGYMFGKGIYFSNVVTKASNYCFPSDKKGIVLLNEVALGKCHELARSQFMLKPQSGSFSTHGVGGSAPDPSGYETHNGILWPMGRTEKIKHPRVKTTSLLYPEFIIYNEAQYRMRYLLRLRFK